MGTRNLTSAILVVVSMLLSTTALAAQPRLQLAWPSAWEHRPPTSQEHAVHLQARQQVGGRTLQLLDLTIIDLRSSRKPITTESIRDLAEQLRKAAQRKTRATEIPLQRFSLIDGYYFVTASTERPSTGSGTFKHVIEGVAVHAGYMFNFSLLTSDAGSSDSSTMLQALQRMRVE